LSNIYIIDKVKDFYIKERRRLIKTSINRRIIYEVFSDLLIKELKIPIFINNYN
jgi:hypothetical protein